MQFYYLHFHEGKRCRLPVGRYDEAGKRGLSLIQARDRAAEPSALYRSGITDLKGHFEREHEAAERKRRAEQEAAKRAEEERQRGTLRQLLEAYIDHLEREGKQAAKDVRSILTKHVLEAAPDLAAMKATEVPRGRVREAP